MDKNISDIQKHSAAHVLAAAVLRLYPEVKIGIGPVTDEGFFYDFDFGDSKLPKDFSKEKIENEANQIIQEGFSIYQRIVPKIDAYNLLANLGQIYKLELLSLINESEVSLYYIGEIFLDLCRGPHVQNTKEIGIIHLTTIEETYWNEDVRRPKMFRIYGKVFNTIEELSEYKKIVTLKKEFSLENIIKKENTNLIINFESKKILYNQENSNLIEKIQEIIEYSIVNYDTQLIHSSDNKYLNLISFEEDLKKMFKGKILSYKNLPISYISKINVEKTNLGNQRNKEESKNVEITIKYQLTGEESVDLDDLIDENISLLQNFGIKNKDLDIQIISNDINNLLANQISQILQKKFISHKKIVDQRINNIIIQFITQNGIQEEYVIMEIYIENSDIFKFMDQFNNLRSSIVIKQLLSKDVIFRFIKTNTRKTNEQMSLIGRISCIPISKKYNEQSQKVNIYLNKQNINSFLDTTSKSLKKKIFQNIKKGKDILIFIGEREVNSNSINLRVQDKTIGLISIEDLIETIKKYL